MALPEGIVALIGASCFYKGAGGEEDDVVVFDWSAVPKSSQSHFLDDVFGDCDVPGDYASLLTRGDDGIEWKSTDCVPFALGGVVSGSDKLDFERMPQFHRLLLVDGSGRAFGIDVDGTAAPAPEPEAIANAWEKLKIKVRPPAKPPGDLPKVKGTKHRQLVGSWGTFEPSTRTTPLVNRIRLSADDARAIVRFRFDSDGDCARVYDTATGALVRELRGAHLDAAISADGTVGYTAHRGASKVEITATLLATGEPTWTKDFALDRNVMIVAAPAMLLAIVENASERTVNAWALDGDTLWEKAFAGDAMETTTALEVSPDGTLLASGSMSGKDEVRIFDTTSGELRRTIAGRAWATGLAWFPDGRRLAVSSSHLTAIYDVSTGELLAPLREYDRGRMGGGIAVSRGGDRVFACTSDGKIELYDADGKLLDKVDLKGTVGAWSIARRPGGFVVGTRAACVLSFDAP